jgi:hypothetical protein
VVKMAAKWMKWMIFPGADRAACDISYMPIHIVNDFLPVLDWKKYPLHPLDAPKSLRNCQKAQWIPPAKVSTWYPLGAHFLSQRAMRPRVSVQEDSHAAGQSVRAELALILLNVPPFC